jgi:hypothetical protein
MKSLIFSAAILIFACQGRTPQYPTQTAQVSTTSSDKKSASSIVEGDTSLKKVVKTEEEWLNQLGKAAYNVLREKGN